MSFKVDTEGADQTSTNTSNKPSVDYDAMNKEVVDIVGTQNKGKVVVGFVSGYIDLGLQPRADFEQLRDENDEKQNKAIEENGATVVTKDFWDNNTKHANAEVFCNPRKPAKAFGLAVDFPQYEVDKGKYFGETSPAPLRLYLGKEWHVVDPDGEDGKKMKIIQNPMYMTENTNNPQNKWALSVNSTISKMCVAADLGDENGLVSKDNITSLLGKPLMFNIRVWNKPSKNDTRKVYFTEDIKFVSAVVEGLPVPEFDENLIHGVNFHQANDVDMLNQVRFHAKNTMKLATDWEKSIIKGEIETVKASYKAPQSQNTPEPKKPVKGEKKVAQDAPQEPSIDFDELDDKIPFAPIGLQYKNLHTCM